MKIKYCIHERVKKKGGSNGRKKQQGKTRKNEKAFTKF